MGDFRANGVEEFQCFKTLPDENNSVLIKDSSVSDPTRLALWRDTSKYKQTGYHFGALPCTLQKLLLI